MKVALLTPTIKASITERISTFEDACNELGISGDTYVELSDNISKMFPFVADVTKAAIIAEALNDGWEADWANTDQPKYQLYFEMNPKNFSLCLVVDCYVNSGVPSRLCFKSRELAQYAVNQFPELYKSFFLNY